KPGALNPQRKALVLVFPEARDGQGGCRTRSSPVVPHTAGVEEVALAARSFFPFRGIPYTSLRRPMGPKAIGYQAGETLLSRFSIPSIVVQTRRRPADAPQPVSCANCTSFCLCRP